MPALLTAPRILVVDDEADLRELLEISILRMGHDVDSAATLHEAKARLTQQPYQLVLTDMRLPDGSGLDVVRYLGQQAGQAGQPLAPVAVITAYGSAENAVEALKAGAFDYLTKPVALDRLRQLIQDALGVKPARQMEAPQLPALPGGSRAMAEVRQSVLRLASSMAPVMITGESGSGKERAARAIHAAGPRANHAFIPVNCGAIPEHLMEAEFFGSLKGAFTGATQERDGFFQAAHGGTLMLDEIGELPLAMQVKLLRAIQERRVRKLGATVEQTVDVRILCATHQDLAAMVAAGKFRQDLYYRLNVLSLAMPPLRARADDIPELARQMLVDLAQRYGAAAGVKRLSAAACSALQQHAFPGNVRELENMLERAQAFAEGEWIEPPDLGLSAPLSPKHAAYSSHVLQGEQRNGGQSEVAPIVEASPAMPACAAAISPLNAETLRVDLPVDLPLYLAQVEANLIRQALKRTVYNRTAAAKLLGLSLRQLRYRMQQLEIRAWEPNEGMAVSASVPPNLDAMWDKPDNMVSELEARGWWSGARRVVSPNCDARPEGVPVELLVLHHISLPPGEFGGEAIEALFTNRLDALAHPAFQPIAALRVSAHFLIRRDGACVQFVACDDRAWHAGVSQFEGRQRCNDFSIGVELEGTEAVPFTPAQYGSLVGLLQVLLRCYPIRALVGHADIAPGRKIDPGPSFDWQRLAALSALPASYFPFGLQAR